MAVKINSAQFSKLVSDSVKARVLVDFSAPPERRQTLTRAFDSELDKAVAKFADKLLPQTLGQVKDHYKESFDIVSAPLQQGLLSSESLDLGLGQTLDVSFHAFTRKYYKQKLRQAPDKADKFWLFSGAVSKSYRQFAGARKGAVTRTRSIASLQSRGYIYRGRRYRYSLELSFPEIRGGGSLDNIFRKAYVLGANAYSDSIRFNEHLGNFGPAVSVVRHSDPLSVLVYNESVGGFRSDGKPRTRPFITELMSKRGRQVRLLISRKFKSIR